MNTLNKIQLELVLLEKINHKQEVKEISALKAQIYREAVRNEIFNILDSLEFLQGK